MICHHFLAGCREIPQQAASALFDAVIRGSRAGFGDNLDTHLCIDVQGIRE
jgi:hypothetical protein